jgi:hypothetical protein
MLRCFAASAGEFSKAEKMSTLQWRVKGKQPRQTKMLVAVLLTLLTTVMLTVSVLNLQAGEKQIRYELPHDFAVEDPQFLRCMGQLLGPGILPGNRVKALQNGEQIFPAMLDAIRGGGGRVLAGHQHFCARPPGSE